MSIRLALSLFLGLAIAAGVALPAAQACSQQRHACSCCPHQQTAPSCAMHCADDYAGLARRDASPFRLTRLPLGRPLQSLAAVPQHSAPPVTPFHLRHPQESPHACASPKRYLLSCDLRL